MRQKGLALKTFIYTFILIIIILSTSFGILYFLLPSFYLKQKSQALSANANALEHNLNVTSDIADCKALIVNFSKNNNSTIIAFDRDGNIIPDFSSPFLLIDDSNQGVVGFSFTENLQENDDGPKIVTKRFLNPPASEDSAESPQMEIVEYKSQNFFFQTRTAENLIIKHLSHNLIGRISISSTLQPIDEAQKVIVSLIPYLMLLDFFIALLPAYIFAKQLTNPILKISDAAAQMQKMQPGVLSNVRTNDELGQLSHNLDQLYLNLCENIESLKLEMEKVAKLEESRTYFMQAAGHELKTPISALNGIIEGMIDNVGVYQNREKYLGECQEQVSSLAKLVNKILLSSQLDHIEDNISLEDVEINEVVGKALGMYKILIEKKQISIAKNEFSYVCKTDYNVLLTTLSNLISNAVNYTEPRGEIIISFNKGAQDILSIENQCAGIDNNLLPKLFEPFFTLDYSRHKSKSGTGLGLYIVKKNLDALKLAFTIENTKLGIKFNIIF